MALASYAQGGSSTLGVSRAWSSLPYNGYREQGGWLQEWVDATCIALDIIYARFVSPAARANLLDPTYTPVEVPGSYFATQNAPPLNAASVDTMLDVLCYVAGVPFPVDTHFTDAQKRALVQIGWDALKRKGTRVQILRLVAAIADGVVSGWTSPPFRFDLILPDQSPAPGYGDWVPADAATSGTRRPWILQSIRSLITQRYFPAWASLGIGFSQFRAGYSGAGEPVFQYGSRTGILQNENFASVTGGAPVNWSASAVTVLSGVAQTNYEFSPNVAMLDLTGTGAGYVDTIGQYSSLINNLVTHRVAVDYAYGNAQRVSTLSVRIFDETNSQYWNPVTQTWTASQVGFAVAPSNQSEMGTLALTSGSSAVVGVGTRFDASWVGYRIVSVGGRTYTIASVSSSTSLTLTANASVTETGLFTRIVRARASFDVIPQRASATAFGTAKLSILIVAASDSTLTTQQQYWLYRAAIHEKFDAAIESNAGGERTLWLPLVDAGGLSVETCSGQTTSGYMLEIADAKRKSYKMIYPNINTALFPYHPALSARALQCLGQTYIWNNLIKGSNDFQSDWTYNGLPLTSFAANATSSPNLLDVTNTAPIITPNVAGSYVAQKNIVSNPSSKSYVAGVWVKSLSATATTISVGMTSGANGPQSIVSASIADGWQLVPLRFTFASSDTTALQFFAGGTVPFSLACAYLYDVTGTPDVLYPPVSVTAVGATAHLGNCYGQLYTNGAVLQNPYTFRSAQSCIAGIMNLTLVPFFDAGSQGDSYIALSTSSTYRNTTALQVVGKVLQFQIVDNAGTTATVGLNLSALTAPGQGFMTWRRDVSIAVRCVWNYDTTSTKMTLSLSAGNGNATYTSDAGWQASDANRNGFVIGQDYNGLISGIEILQSGTPVT